MIAKNPYRLTKIRHESEKDISTPKDTVMKVQILMVLCV